jgi:hypothetical protein
MTPTCDAPRRSPAEAKVDEGREKAGPARKKSLDVQNLSVEKLWTTSA